MAQKLSVLLPTYNNETSVRSTLESVQWVDEILVVDSYSTDRTLEICREYGARILQHEYIQSARQKNWGIPQCAHDWVLQLDTDEQLEPGARDEIRQAIDAADPSTGAFRLPRKNHILGRWVQVTNLYPDYQTRLFRRDARFEDKEVHAHVRVPGKVGTLRRHILHDGMPSIGKQLRNLDRYTRYQADEYTKLGRTVRWHHLALRPLAVFTYYYVWRRGFTEGYRGLIICALTATFDFWAHAKRWEVQALGLKASPR